MLNGIIEGTQALSAVQDQCTIWGDDKIASCRDCPHYPENKKEYRYSLDPLAESGWCAAECKARPDCPLNIPRTPISSSDRYNIKDDHIPCIFPGCKKYCDHDAKIDIGCYCDHHYRIVYKRKFNLHWPDERLHDPINKSRMLRQCSFPDCERMQGSQYCKYHFDLIRKRKYILKWPDERLLEPPRKFRKPNRRKK